jgi:hypothetical protein
MAYSLLGEEGTLGESLHNVRVVFLEDCEDNSVMDSRGDVHG